MLFPVLGHLVVARLDSLYSHSARGEVPAETHKHSTQHFYLIFIQAMKTGLLWGPFNKKINHLTCQMLFSLSADNPLLEV